MKKFLQKIGAALAKAFSDFKKFLGFLESHVDDAIDIVKRIRASVDSPVVLSLLMFLPERLRNSVGEAREKTITVLDGALQELLQGEICLEKETTLEKLQCFIAQVKKLSPAKQEALYSKLASLITKHSDGAKQSTSYYDTAVQTRFFSEKTGIQL